MKQLYDYIESRLKRVASEMARNINVQYNTGYRHGLLTAQQLVNSVVKPEGKRFLSGQKVWCWYHSTVLYSPPMCGKILFKLPFKRRHRFAYMRGYDYGKCPWYFVLMQNGLIILHPETCIDDIEEAIKKHDEDNITPKNPEQLRSWMVLNKWQAERVRFLNDR